MPAQPKRVFTGSPQPISGRAVPDEIGGGSVKMYDAKTGVPSVVNEPPEWPQRWVLVHMPSRRWMAVKSKEAALSILQEIKEGKRREGVSLLLPEGKKGRASARAHATKKACGKAAAAGAAPAANEQEATKTGEEPSSRLEKPPPTPVPADMDFDKAMKAVFPVSRITAKLESMLTASTPIYGREGDYLGDKEEFFVQLQGLKLLIEYHQGRPNEKEKQKKVTPPLTLQELRAKCVVSEEFRNALLEMIMGAASDAKGKAAVPPTPTQSK